MSSAVNIANLEVVAVRTGATILHGVNLSVDAGEVLAVVGESGSGKSTLGLAMLGYARAGTAIRGGSVLVGAVDMLGLDSSALRAARGRTVAYVPQDPGMSLNPSLSIRTQLTEVIGSGRDELASVRRILEEVGLPSDDAFLARRPGQLSGGQQQRVGIAMAVVAAPDLVILDEPTTGLDVTTQLMVLDLVARLTKSHRMAAVYITHDLGVVGKVANRVAVLKDGRIVEEGPTRVVLGTPGDEYTRMLVRAVPSIHDHESRARAVPGEVVLSAEGLAAAYGTHQVLDDVTFTVSRGECLAIVGESGSGKSTMSRALIGLHRGDGDLRYHGELLHPRASRRSREQRRRVQYVFQNPYASLQPRRTIGESIAVPIRYFEAGSAASVRERVNHVLDRVELGASFADRFPGELSGGQRQRAAIARALAAQPELMICDEITSALDVSVQAKVLTLLKELQDDGLAMVFITHNLAVVSAIADRVAVLQKGRIVEIGRVDEVLDRPTSAYASRLLGDTLDLSDMLIKSDSAG